MATISLCLGCLCHLLVLTEVLVPLSSQFVRKRRRSILRHAADDSWFRSCTPGNTHCAVCHRRCVEAIWPPIDLSFRTASSINYSVQRRIVDGNGQKRGRQLEPSPGTSVLERGNVCCPLG